MFVSDVSPGRSHAEPAHAPLIFLRAWCTEYPEDANYQLELARAYRSQYWLIGSRRNDNRDGGQDEREAIRAAGVSILEELVRQYPNVPDYRCELSEMLITTSSRSRRYKGNVAELDRAVLLARGLTESHPSIPRYQAVLARGLTELADSQYEKQPVEADQLFEESISILHSLVLDFPDIPVYQFFLVHAYKEQAETLRQIRAR